MICIKGMIHPKNKKFNILNFDFWLGGTLWTFILTSYESFCWVRKSCLWTKRVFDHQYLLCFNMFDRQILTFGYGTPGTYSGGQKYVVFYFARSITPTKFCWFSKPGTHLKSAVLMFSKNLKLGTSRTLSIFRIF